MVGALKVQNCEMKRRPTSRIGRLCAKIRLLTMFSAGTSCCRFCTISRMDPIRNSPSSRSFFTARLDLCDAQLINGLPTKVANCLFFETLPPTRATELLISFLKSCNTNVINFKRCLAPCSLSPSISDMARSTLLYKPRCESEKVQILP